MAEKAYEDIPACPFLSYLIQDDMIGGQVNLTAWFFEAVPDDSGESKKN